MTSKFASALSVLKQEKPHSSISDWVDILTGESYADDSYDGIPELLYAILIQDKGPTEASRAIRKKLKHGNPHQQYRALVILNAFVENTDTKLKSSLFSDGLITDVLRNMHASDSTTDPKVRKKLRGVLALWNLHYQKDPYMMTVAKIYNPHKSDREGARRLKEEELEAAKRKSKEEARQKEVERLKEEKRKKKEGSGKPKPKRRAFNFEEEKPKILTQIASATQSANNLVNAITLVNKEHETLEENGRVQECLDRLERERKPIVRYIQLVDNEDMIGTLIETNERIIAALEMHKQAISKSAETQDGVDGVQKGLASVKIGDSEPTKLQEKQRAVGRAIRGETLHPDLEDLNFGELGEDRNALPPPLQPNPRDSSSAEDQGRGSLSDFSDYESSDEETHNKYARNVASSSNNYSGRNSYQRSPDLNVTKGNDPPEGDPFADPFGDSNVVNVSASTRENGRRF